MLQRTHAVGQVLLPALLSWIDGTLYVPRVGLSGRFLFVLKCLNESQDVIVSLHSISNYVVT